MLLKTLNLNSNNLYNIADNKTKSMTDTCIEELKEKGLLIGYFGMLANNIYKRSRVKNSEILELLIYGTYIEEQSKLDKYEQQIMYDDVNYYYQQGQEEVLKANKKKNKPSILDMALFLYLLEQPNYTGANYNQCIQAAIQYNAQQLYRQVLIDIQQQKELEIENNEFQRIINQQQNTKLCINDDKISGFMDTQLIGLNNQAKIEGIKELDSNAKVRFIAVIDGNETEMCHSLDGQVFYIDKENEFNRYYGETQKDLRIEKIRCKGLVLGLNLPPISHHFHWCRSYIEYLPVEVVEDIIFDNRGNIIVNGLKILNNTELNRINRIALLYNLNRMEKVFKDFPILKDRDIKYKVVKTNDNSAMAVRPTKKGNYILEINENIFNFNIRDFYKEGIKQNTNVKGTTYKDIGIHEAGHMISFEIIKKVNNNNLQAMSFDYNNLITTNNIVEKAFNNLKIHDIIRKEKAVTNISNYALTNSEETIAEAFTDYYRNKDKANILSKEIVNVMKGMMKD